jgi:Heavy metal binding domain
MKSVASTAVCAALFSACVSVPPAPNRTVPDPSDPSAPQASARPLHPNLVATTKVYLDPSLGQEAQKMEHGNMQGMAGMERMQGMDHSKMSGTEAKQQTSPAPVQQPGAMEGMDHSKMPGMTSQPQNKEILEKEMKKTSDVTYTCVMHPEVKSDKPDNCPKCGMKLVPKPAAQ